MSDRLENLNDDEVYLETVRRIVSETNYGNVNLIIQDGRVIQIDKTEKRL